MEMPRQKGGESDASKPEHSLQQASKEAQNHRLRKILKALAVILPLVSGSAEEKSAQSPAPPPTYATQSINSASAERDTPSVEAEQRETRLLSLEEVEQYGRTHLEKYRHWFSQETETLMFDVQLAFVSFELAYGMKPTPAQLDACRALLVASGIILTPQLIVSALRDPQVRQMLLEKTSEELEQLALDLDATVLLSDSSELIAPFSSRDLLDAISEPQKLIREKMLKSRENLDGILEGYVRAAIKRLRTRGDEGHIILNEEAAVEEFFKKEGGIEAIIRSLSLDPQLLGNPDDLVQVVREAYEQAARVAQKTGAVPTKGLIADILKNILLEKLSGKEVSPSDSAPGQDPHEGQGGKP